MRRRERIHGNFKLACKHRSAPMQFFDLVRHKLKINTHWEDYYQFEFYRLGKSWEERSRYLGVYGSRFWPWEGNSLKYDRLFIFKSLQKAILIASNLPTPPLLLKAGLNHTVNTKSKFKTAMENVDRPVMTKFDGGGGGLGIFSLEPENGKFRCGNRIVDSDWIWQQYESSIERGFLVEERVNNHPLMDSVNPSSLNTMRLTTVKTADGKWHLLLPHVKFGRNGAPVDNLSSGGLFAGIDDTGHAGAAYDRATGESFDLHPDTGEVIKGLKIPWYDEARELAYEASQAFGFMATIAWDVGLTPHGPVIIEGNPSWKLRGVQEILGPYLSREAAAGIAPRSWWTPWDRTHMYPQYMKDAHGGWGQRFMARRRQQWSLRLQA